MTLSCFSRAQVIPVRNSGIVKLVVAVSVTAFKNMCTHSPCALPLIHLTKISFNLFRFANFKALVSNSHKNNLNCPIYQRQRSVHNDTHQIDVSQGSHSRKEVRVPLVYLSSINVKPLLWTQTNARQAAGILVKLKLKKGCNQYTMTKIK